MKAQSVLAMQMGVIQALAAQFRTAGTATSLFETHISWVLVAGHFAYKFKKAVHFGFLDFSTLELRRFYCIEELRLNRRLAPGLYLDVIGITGSAGRPQLAGDGAAIEYAVKMRAFEQDALWSWRLPRGLVAGTEIDGLAWRLADFHRAAAVAPVDDECCGPPQIAALALENLDAIERAFGGDRQGFAIGRLRHWDAEQRRRLEQTFIARRQGGAVRECHGDLHAGNVVTIDGHAEAFDCIEFNPALRWNDVMSELAFLGMDLAFHGQAGLEARFINHYLERSGDYGGLPLLQYYRVQRALVRSKVALMRAAQCRNDAPAVSRWRSEAEAYLAFAVRAAAPPVRLPALVITHGFSGSGKSTLARRLVELLPALQLRSDVERKRMLDLAATAKGDSRLYTEQVSLRTYERLFVLADQALRAGWTVVVDAAFLRQNLRMEFARLAAELRIPFVMLDLRASEPTLRARVAQREHCNDDASDAGLAVLERQLAAHQPLGSEERARAIGIDMESMPGERELLTLCARIRSAPAPLTDRSSPV